MTRPLAPLSETFPETRLALHRVAAYVVSPARRRSMGRMGLRATPGGFGTPTFAGPDGITRVSVEGADLAVHSDGGRRTHPVSTLAEVGAFAGVEPDVEWASELDIPSPGDLDGRLSIEDRDAEALARWFAFAWGILESLSMDPESDDASDPQLWPEHFDPAIEIGSDENKARASYGFSPGDVAKDATAGPEPLPYVYVGPWYPDDKPESDYWSAGRLAILRYADLVDEPDPAAAARAFLLEGRSLLTGR